MSKRNRILTLMLLALPLSMALGQDSSSSQPASAPPQDGSQQTGAAPAPGFGMDTQPGPVSENPPISGIDQPGLEPHAAPLSYLQPGLHLSESADSNLQDTLGGTAVHSVTRALGSLELERLWSHYDLAVNYVGGVGYYSAYGLGVKNIEQLDLDQKITWKRGQLGIRDSFSYMPEGSFGGAYGAEGGLGQTLGGGPPGGFWGPSSYGSLGQVPRIMNLSLVDVVQSLSPKSSFTAAVGYGFVHYTGDTGIQGISFLGSTQISAEAGYNRVLSKHDQLAVVYGYQQFNFSGSGSSFHSNVAQLLWGHRISGRMDLILGAGPQFTEINTLQPSTLSTQNTNIPPCEQIVNGTTSFLECPVGTLKLSVAARASLRYKFPKTMVNLTFERFNTNGSGFFAGAETESVQLNASRPLTRVWSVTTDLGFAHNRREVSLTEEQEVGCLVTATACAGAIANSFDYTFAGVALHRMLGRNFHLYGSYQFNELFFDPSFCGFNASGMSLSPCSRISQRHVGTIGLDWTPRPIRLD
jgi:hypothetical protein